MRKIIIAGNWKMHKTNEEAEKLARGLLEVVKPRDNVKMVLCPPFTALERVSKVIEGSFIELGAQNLFYEKEGAYTGEISPLMLKSVGCRYVIIGHSERRKYFKETDELINRKIRSAIQEGLIPIFCVGETLEERERGKAQVVVERQVREGLKDIDREGEVVIAYEPVWAIGTGRTATPETASQMHKFIRAIIGEIWGEVKAQEITILYGGSVKPENIDSLMSQDEIDGVLVGGASLDVNSFARIYNFQA
ncbi:MAG TPA: triose-phosphate isomerase [bacterium]|nr:triose-phosphate isomerase [bacterium]HEX67821.1 triose-phosphate isomerase [bacterium]